MVTSMRSQHCSALGSAFTTPTARTRARAPRGHTGGHTGEGEGDISQGHGTTWTTNWLFYKEDRGQNDKWDNFSIIWNFGMWYTARNLIHLNFRFQFQMCYNAMCAITVPPCLCCPLRWLVRTERCPKWVQIIYNWQCTMWRPSSNK